MVPYWVLGDASEKRGGIRELILFAGVNFIDHVLPELNVLLDKISDSSNG